MLSSMQQNFVVSHSQKKKIIIIINSIGIPSFFTKFFNDALSNSIHFYRYNTLWTDHSMILVVEKWFHNPFLRLL